MRIYVMADVKSYIFRLGTALLVSIGYLDPANWATNIEAGSRFGCDLVWVVILANFISSLVQYLVSRLNFATGEHLTQACLDEFPRGACFVLWLLSEAVLVSLDAATILGTAVGLNLVLRIPLLLGIILVAGGTSILSDKRNILDFRRILWTLGTIVLVVLLCFVVTTIFGKHDFWGAVYFGMWPRLRNDSAHVAAALIGASFVAHIGTENQCFSETQHFSGMALGFGTSVLVNLAIITIATATAHASGFAVLTLQDGFALFEPFLGRSCAPLAFGLTILCSGILSTLQRPPVLGSAFGGINPHVHRHVIRGAAVILASYCTLHGNEGVYQLLLLSKAIVALQLPFVLVPLIRLTSSTGYMGKHKIPYILEAVAWVLLLFLQSLNFWAILAPLFSDGDDWGGLDDFVSGSGEASFSSGPTAVILQTILMGFLVWLTFTPMKADLLKQGEITALEEYNHRESIEWEYESRDKIMEIVKPEEFDTGAGLAALPPLEDISEQVDSLAGIEELSLADEIIGAGVTDHEPDLIADVSPEDTVPAADNVVDNEDEVSVSDSSLDATSLQEMVTEVTEVTVSEVTEVTVSEDSVSEVIVDGSVDSPEEAADVDIVAEVEKRENSSTDVELVEDLDQEQESAINKEIDSLDKEDGWENLEHDEVVCEASGLEAGANSLAYEGPDSMKSIRSGTFETGHPGSGSGSLSRLSGLGRAARRQFAAVLDEFWGNLFDLHGQVVLPGTQSSPIKNDRTHQSWEGDGPYSLPTAAKRGRRNTFQTYPAPVDAYGRTFSHLTASTSDGAYGGPVEYPSISNDFGDFGERRYYSMRHSPQQPEYDYQPATIHGYSLASYANRGSSVGSPRSRPLHLDVPSLGSRTPTDLNFQAAFPQYSKASEAERIRTDSSSYMRPLGDGSTGSFLSGQTPDREYNQWNMNRSWDKSNPLWDKWNPLVYRATGELDIGRDKDGAAAGLSSFEQAPIGRAGSPEYSPALHSEPAPLSFDEISPSQSHRDGFSIQASSQSESLWSKQPFEQLFGPPGFGTTLHQHHPAPRRGGPCVSAPVTTATPRVFSLPNGIEFGFEVFDHLRVCIGRLLQLEGAEWLFRLENGCDEDLVAGVAAREKSLMEAQFLEPVNVYSNGSRSSSWQMLARSTAGGDSYQDLVPGVPHCGDTCVWGSSLLLSFGVWCVHRILELSLMESRPELWGKYTYVLNRLQGILEPAFTKSRVVSRPCMCLQGYQAVSKRTSYGDASSYPFPWSWGRNASNPNYKPPSANLYLDMIKEVETAVSSRKGRTGTAAGDVAFPKGKENLASVLKRYKRRLGNKAGNSNNMNGNSNNMSNNNNRRVF